MNNKYLKKSCRIKLLIPFLLLVATSLSQNSFASQVPALSEIKLKQTITEISSKIRKLYVTEPEGKKIAQAITDHYNAGNYAGLDGVTLANKITEDLYAASNDLHMYIHYDPESAGKSATSEKKEQAGGRPSESEMKVFKDRAQEANFGYHEFKWLPEKVAVISISQWDQLSWNERKIDSMMQLAEGANAIIFDVRSNIGGSPEGARYIQSHFLDKVIPMIIFRNRQEKEPFIDNSAPSVNGEKRVGLPMYVLIDGQCASACEDFALTSRDAGIATLVGETTAGAGYMNAVMPIADTFQMSISIAGAFSAKTGDNWQTKGVSPDVEVLAPDALTKAYSMILANLAAESQNPQEKQRIERRESWLHDDLDLRDDSLADYQAIYGESKVELKGRYLKLSKGHTSHYFTRLARDVFVEAIRGNTRLRFNRDSAGSINSLSLLRAGSKMKVKPRNT